MVIKRWAENSCVVDIKVQDQDQDQDPDQYQDQDQDSRPKTRFKSRSRSRFKIQNQDQDQDQDSKSRSKIQDPRWKIKTWSRSFNNLQINLIFIWYLHVDCTCSQRIKELRSGENKLR